MRVFVRSVHRVLFLYVRRNVHYFLWGWRLLTRGIRLLSCLGRLLGLFVASGWDLPEVKLLEKVDFVISIHEFGEDFSVISEVVN